MLAILKHLHYYANKPPAEYQPNYWFYPVLERICDIVKNNKPLCRMTLQDKLKSNILRDFDGRLQTELSMDLYSFIANVQSDNGDSFHNVVNVIFKRDGAKGLKEFLNSLAVMLEEFREDNSN